MITFKYCLLVATWSWCAEFSCCSTEDWFLCIALNWSHLVMDLTWFSLLPCFASFSDFQFLNTNEVSFPNSTQAKHTHASFIADSRILLVPFRLKSSHKCLIAEFSSTIFTQYRLFWGVRGENVFCILTWNGNLFKLFA